MCGGRAIEQKENHGRRLKKRSRVCGSLIHALSLRSAIWPLSSRMDGSLVGYPDVHQLAATLLRSAR
jgi:hypothetical protein